MIETRQSLTLDAALFEYKEYGTYCEFVFVRLTQARWSADGGNLKGEGKHAQFAAAKIGTYTVTARTTKYGTTTRIIKVQAHRVTVLSNFDCGACGVFPTGFVEDASGAFYGTTQQGGSASGSCSDGCGAVFRFTHGASGSHMRPIYLFQGGSDGSDPIGGVVANKDGVLFGTTPYGGHYNLGQIFKLVRHGSTYAKGIVHSFRGGKDGAVPLTGLVAGPDGKFYGTTQAGGGNRPLRECHFYIPGCGTVYELIPHGSTYSERIIHAFTAKNDGAAPFAGVTIGPGGNIYGTTYYGGSGSGTVFRLTRRQSGYAETFRYSFGGNDGAQPSGLLVIDSEGGLYGTTQSGGASANGTVFKLTPSGKSYTETTLYSFKGSSDGSYPACGVTLGSGGVIYGTTTAGGGPYSGGGGIAFNLTPAGSSYVEHILHRFSPSNGGLDGSNPAAGLLPGPHGTFYSVTSIGGSRNAGAVYSLRPQM